MREIRETQDAEAQRHADRPERDDRARKDAVGEMLPELVHARTDRAAFVEAGPRPARAGEARGSCRVRHHPPSAVRAGRGPAPTIAYRPRPFFMTHGSLQIPPGTAP